MSQEQTGKLMITTSLSSGFIKLAFLGGSRRPGALRKNSILPGTLARWQGRDIHPNRNVFIRGQVLLEKSFSVQRR